MDVNVAKISGLDDAILALNYSKRTISSERREYIRGLVAENTDANGFITKESDYLGYEMAKVFKYGIAHGHEVLLSFIDITIELDGLHRAGQDDWDAHAYRFHNRIIRSSTRLAKFEGSEQSNYYTGKVLTTEQVVGMTGLEIPDHIIACGRKYDRLDGIGYVNEDYEGNQDVIRGLYRLQIPSDSITKINYRELRHVYNMRNKDSHANPEVKKVAEDIRGQLNRKAPCLGYMLGKVWASGQYSERGNTETVIKRAINS